MIKSFAIAALVSGLLASAVCAQTTTGPSTTGPSITGTTTTGPTSAPAQSAGGAPESPDQCLKAASDLAQSAEEHKLGEAQLDKIEDLLTKMESHCDAKQFLEAMAVGNDIKTLIETR